MTGGQKWVLGVLVILHLAVFGGLGLFWDNLFPPANPRLALMEGETVCAYGGYASTGERVCLYSETRYRVLVFGPGCFCGHELAWFNVEDGVIQALAEIIARGWEVAFVTPDSVSTTVRCSEDVTYQYQTVAQYQRQVEAAVLIRYGSSGLEQFPVAVISDPEMVLPECLGFIRPGYGVPGLALVLMAPGGEVLCTFSEKDVEAIWPPVGQFLALADAEIEKRRKDDGTR